MCLKGSFRTVIHQNFFEFELVLKIILKVYRANGKYLFIFNNIFVKNEKYIRKNSHDNTLLNTGISTYFFNKIFSFIGIVRHTL